MVVSEFNSARTIGRCLDSLLAQDYPDYHVVVVDAGSKDGTIDFVKKRECDRLSLIISKGCSEPRGQNIGIVAYQSDIILFTNSDCYVAPDWISRHVSWHQRRYDMVGGKLFWGGDEYAFAWSYLTPDKPSDSLTSGLSLGFSNCSITRKLYDDIGGFKDMRAQHDMDFWIRGTKAGMKAVMDPKIEVYHDHPMKSFRGSFLRSFNYGRNHVTLLRKSYGRGPWPNYATFPYSKTTFQELFLIQGVRVWKQQRDEAQMHDIDVFLPTFLFLRLLGFKVPNLLGWFRAMASPIVNVSKVEVADAHRWGR